MPALSSRRRFVVGAKAAFGVCEATVFPGATELLLRPGGGTWRDLASAERWRSLAFAEPDAGTVEAAKRALARADALAAEGSLQEAEELYRAAADGVGYKGYKIWQAATLRRGQLEVKLGDAAGNGTTGKVWLWGRGVRFPGWYILAVSLYAATHVERCARKTDTGCCSTCRCAPRARRGWRARRARRARRGGDRRRRTRARASARLPWSWRWEGAGWRRCVSTGCRTCDGDWRGGSDSGVQREKDFLLLSRLRISPST